MDRYALVIGIPEYNNFTPLPKTTNDAEEVAKCLESYGGFQVTRVPKKANLNKDGYEMKSGKVTCEELKREISIFLLERAKNKNALIYFTGHGFTLYNSWVEKK